MRRLAARFTLGLVAIFLAATGAVALVGEPITAVSLAFVDRYGVLGVLGGALLCDLLGVPKEPVMLLGYAGGLGAGAVIAAGSAAALAAALIGWSLGRRFGRVPWVRDRLAATPVGPLLHRYGARAVAVAAVGPFPFAAMTWAAGAVRLPLRVFLAGTLFRVPKLLVAFGLVVSGSSLGSWLGG